MADSIRTKAIVLNSIRWQDSSKIVSLFTENAGIVKVIARGAFRSNSPFAGKLESMLIVEAIILVKESRSLQILKEIEVTDTLSRIKSDMNIYPYGFAILEIVSQLFNDHPADPVFYNFIVTMLESIQKIKNPAVVILYLLLKVASYLGFKPNLQTCQSGEMQNCDQSVFLSLDDGSIFWQNCGIIGSNILKLKREEFYYLKNLQNWNHRRITDIINDHPNLDNLTQLMLNYINFHLEHELRMSALHMLGK